MAFDDAALARLGRTEYAMGMSGIDDIGEAGAAYVAGGGSDLARLVSLCPDPYELYVVSPTPVRVKELAQLYSFGDPGVVPDLMRDLKQRMTAERWVESRAAFQARRFKAKQDAIIEVEATVMAMMGIDFQVQRVRFMQSRWESLTTYVEDRLAACAQGMAIFDAPLGIACREARELEAEMSAFFPSVGIEERAARQLVTSSEKREDLINEVARKLGSLGGVESGRKVLRLVNGGQLEQIDAEDQD